MLNRLGKLLINFSALFFPGDEHVPDRGRMDYFRAVEQARKEWQDAKKRFDQISDPDLIDHAIYAVEATERRYMYLLIKAREGGVTLSSPESPHQ